MSIFLFHSVLNEEFGFGFGGNIAEDEVFFCINRPQTVKYFLEDLADYFDDDTYGFCHSSDWGNPEKFLKRIFSMKDEDISKIDLVCQFLAGKEIQEWMKSGKSKSNYGNHKSLGNKKLKEFYSSDATLKKISTLGQKCKNVKNM